MALFLPILLGAPIGYFTWSKVFDAVDDRVYRITQSANSNNAAPIFALGCSLLSAGLLGKLTFPQATRHRLFFAKAPANSNIRIVTLKLGFELLARAGIVFYGAATGGAIGGRLMAQKNRG
ncbi:hypothetical protein BDF20DRAFT_826411 [Mycotypha africana]|uniref:uncharacterized protein n=1 Tax=Mycotypha africana TaxID=64632 RepID=UPI002300E906|nr:uncharacterized protein BDF20DRAFT_826411 [Mycotypha africana]KAI8969937.1 hypothetical protein BDF20DRAFT_826411 [Mycotypha africana]